MRHLKKTAKLGRTSEHRNRMLTNLVSSLIKHRRIQTTLAKAKAAQRVAERMLTLGKRGNAAVAAATTGDDKAKAGEAG
jgi:large subunit ribosomal protein L17